VQRLATIAHGDGVCTTNIPAPPTPQQKPPQTRTLQIHTEQIRTQQTQHPHPQANERLSS
jgi:hypothetical protein